MTPANAHDAHDALRVAMHVALVTLALLLVPLGAMYFTDQVRWSAMDFIVAAVLMFTAGFTFARVLRSTRRPVLRAAFGLALAGALLLVWVNLAVGILGRPGHPFNLMYVGVLAIGIGGAMLARLKPRGMARAMLATAAAMTLAALATVAAGFSVTATPLPVIVISHGLFVVLFLASAWLFRRSARAPAVPSRPRRR
jgi:hypothetical protein